MLRLVAVRLTHAVPVLLIIAVLAFLLMQLLPGDPAVLMAGDGASAEAIQQIRERLQLDRPLWEQLVSWVTHLLSGDLGTSLTLNQTVVSAVAERLPVSLSLAVVSIAITVPVGILLGVIAAAARDSWIDVAVMAIALLGVSVPSFWIAILSVILFSVTLGWLPSAGYVPLSDGFLPWLLALLQPAIVLALFQVGFLARMTRSAMLDVLDQDFIRTARAKGAPESRVLWKHGFRNTLIAVLTVVGYIFSLLIGGSVIVEQVFALPGVGRLVVQAVLARDYPLVQGTLLLFGFIFVLINIATDILYVVVDPRVRYD
ncbi:peptide ABC transporter [Bradyrhizobium sp. NAS80.1]|uniref:ABC transporter permease n=1 Tax=Bradyrhizobium sp. NAS80.1 TaxID=1680159 RepID=UPI00095CA9E1|nr:ABC transporter permease [Bradyrhizobium sp. NAS80.1]OKO87684.1 peptide ABC transporter [Bradyrhizobium sp. NAS80.1]